MATVSRGAARATAARWSCAPALKGQPRVSPETAARIRSIARDAGFTVSAIARSLATQRTAMIGVVVTTITDPFHHDIIAGSLTGRCAPLIVHTFVRHASF